MHQSPPITQTPLFPSLLNFFSFRLKNKNLKKSKKMLERVRDGDHWPDHPNGIEPDNLSVDQMLQSDKVPKWTEQLTVRAFIVSLLVGTFLTIIILRLSITTGIVPAFNIVAGLLGFFLVKSWTRVLEATGLSRTPFTRQENTIIQTCIVACTSIGFSGIV